MKTSNLIHRCVHLSFEESNRFIMNNSHQFDVSFTLETLPKIPKYPLPKRIKMAQYGSKGHEGLTAQSHLFEHRLGVAHAKTPHKKEFHIYNT